MRRRSGFGWLDLLLGIGLICLGILALVQPDWALTTLVVAYGIAAVVMGVTDILLFIRVERYTGLDPILSLISGVLSVMTGLMLVVYPHAGVLMLTVLFPIWFIAHVISRLMHLPQIRVVAGNGIYYLSLIIHIIGLILGIVMLFNPILTVTALRSLVGVYLLLLGIDSIVLAVSRMGMQ